MNGNRTQAAKVLGISLRTLRNKLREYQGGSRIKAGDEWESALATHIHLPTPSYHPTPTSEAGLKREACCHKVISHHFPQRLARLQGLPPSDTFEDLGLLHASPTGVIFSLGFWQIPLLTMAYGTSAPYRVRDGYHLI